MKMFGDMSIMSSMIVAAAAAATAKPNQSNINNSNLYQNNAANMINMAAFKYNNIYNQQFYTESLAKFMSSYYKPSEIMKRLFPQSGININDTNSTVNNASTTITSNANSHLLTNQSIHSINQNNIRYHPYLKFNNHSNSNNTSNTISIQNNVPIDLLNSQSSTNNKTHIDFINVSNSSVNNMNTLNKKKNDQTSFLKNVD